MQIKEVQDVIARNYPGTMKYTEARPLKIKRKVKSVRIPRMIGVTADNIMSVELLGWKDNIRTIEFMVGLHDVNKAAAVMMAVAATIETAVPQWDDEDTEWFKKAIASHEDNERGNVSIKFITVPAAKTIPIMFVRIRPETAVKVAG